MPNETPFSNTLGETAIRDASTQELATESARAATENPRRAK